MSPEPPGDLARRIAATVQVTATPDAEQRLLPHIKWEVVELMRRVSPDDLEASELIAIAGILAAAHSRILMLSPGPGPRRPRRLRLVR